jgi:hypothetical protein
LRRWGGSRVHLIAMVIRITTAIKCTRDPPHLLKSTTARPVQNTVCGLSFFTVLLMLGIMMPGTCRVTNINELLHLVGSFFSLQLYAPDDGRRNRPKHVEHTRNKYIKNSCILLVVISNYTNDARTHEHQNLNLSIMNTKHNMLWHSRGNGQIHTPPNLHNIHFVI